MTDGMSDVTYG